MPATDEFPGSDVIRPAPEASPPEPRRRWMPAALVAVVAIVAVAIGGLVLLSGDGNAPEDVVVDSLEAFNDRDRAALESLYDPNLAVSIDFRPVGGEFMPDEVGRDLTLDQTEEFWRVADPTISWEVVSATDGTVVIDQATMFGVGTPDRLTSTYTVVDGVITRIDHVVTEIGQ